MFYVIPFSYPSIYTDNIILFITFTVRMSTTSSGPETYYTGDRTCIFKTFTLFFLTSVYHKSITNCVISSQRT